jgi:hypothetical protein
MKAIKFLTLAFAALALMGCPKEPGNGTGTGSDEPTAVVITMETTQYSCKVGETVQIEATVAPEGTVVEWASLNEAVATVNNSGLVTGVSKGNTIVTIAAGDVKKNAIVNVLDGDAPKPGEKPVLKGSQFWPIYLDAVVVDENASKLGFSLTVDNVNKNLYIWESTYVGGGASGSNYFQTNDAGGFLSFRPADGTTWSGCGFSLKSEAIEEKALLTALVEDIKKDPSKYHLHMAIKSTYENGPHYFTLFGLGAGNTTGLKWCVGNGYEAESNGKFEITYDGSWQVIDFTFDRYIAALEQYVAPTADKGVNYFTFGSGKDANNTLNLDAIYIYKE